MRIQRLLRAARRRARTATATATTAAVATSLVLVGVGAAPPAAAAWHDHAALDLGTISAGLPALTVAGFDGLSAEFATGALQSSSRVTVTNTGDVSLASFEVNAALEAGAQELHDALTVTLAPSGGGAAESLDAWLSGLTLPAGAGWNYDAVASISPSDLDALRNTQASIDIVVTAHAGTSWVVAAGDGFAITVGDTAPPTPGPNVGMYFTAYSAHNIDVQWDPPPGSDGSTVFHVWIGTHMLPDQGSFYWPHHSLSSNAIPTALWPATGQTAAVTIFVTVGGSATPVASGTIWLTGVSGGEPTIAVVPPGARAAPGPTAAAPAAPSPMSAASSPAPMTATPAAPAAPGSIVTAAPTGTPEPTTAPPSAPALPGSAPAPSDSTAPVSVAAEPSDDADETPAESDPTAETDLPTGRAVAITPGAIATDPAATDPAASAPTTHAPTTPAPTTPAPTEDTS